VPQPKWQRIALLEMACNVRSMPAHTAWPRASGQPVEGLWSGEELPAGQWEAHSELVGCSQCCFELQHSNSASGPCLERQSCARLSPTSVASAMVLGQDGL